MDTHRYIIYAIQRCPNVGGVLISEGVVLCTGFNGIELGPEDESLFREVSSIGTKLKCPDYGGVLISEGVVLCTGFNGVELGPKDVSLLERCPLLGVSSISVLLYVPLPHSI